MHGGPIWVGKEIKPSLSCNSHTSGSHCEEFIKEQVREACYWALSVHPHHGGWHHFGARIFRESHQQAVSPPSWKTGVGDTCPSPLKLGEGFAVGFLQRKHRVDCGLTSSWGI